VTPAGGYLASDAPTRNSTSTTTVGRCGRATADDMLAALTAHRIVTTRTARAAGQPDAPGVPVAELVHDALIRDWDALREWVSRDHRFQDWLRRADEQRARWADQLDPRRSAPRHRPGRRPGLVETAPTALRHRGVSGRQPPARAGWDQAREAPRTRFWLACSSSNRPGRPGPLGTASPLPNPSCGSPTAPLATSEWVCIRHRYERGHPS
jgi:hypothetical protein